MKALSALCFAVVLLGGSASAQTTWYVDVTGTPPGTGTRGEPYTAIQYAIDRPTTVAGDTLLIHPGTYAESLDLSGKTLALRGLQGRALTAVDAGGGDPALVVASGEGPGTLVEGLTFRGGSEYEGGGVYLSGSSLTMVACDVRECQASGRGGGIYALGSSLTLVSCGIEANDSWEYGSGVFVEGGTLWVEDTTFADNCTFDYSGALHVEGGVATIVGATFLRNDSEYGWGGGLYVDGAGDVTVVGSRFDDNTAAEGGAAFVRDGELTVHSSRFLDNRASASAYSETGYGGGILASGGSTVTVRRTLFSGNTASGATNGNEFDGRGGAVYGPATLTRCTLADNVADGFFGDASGGGASGGLVLNSCIVWGNTPNALGDPLTEGAEADAGFSDVQGGWAGSGNLDVDPRFVDAAANRYRLRFLSPCIDGGDPALVEDADGTRADMGAFPFLVLRRHPAFAGDSRLPQ